MLFLKESRKADDIVIPSTTLDDDDELNGIRCPLCAWRPSPRDLWCCLRLPDSPEPPFPSCGTMWNTFSTRGKCPGCRHQWKWTTCFQCHQWSLHDDWYEQRRG
jgi:hypothetical protein